MIFITPTASETEPVPGSSLPPRGDGSAIVVACAGLLYHRDLVLYTCGLDLLTGPPAMGHGGGDNVSDGLANNALS